MNVPHPIPYQGSKRNLATKILYYFPENVPRLIEPFAGSGALSIAAAYQQKADLFVINDVNSALINLWNKILHDPETLANQYDWLWHKQLGRERRFYDLVRIRFNKTQRPDYFLYLLARCVKASVRYNASGEFNQSPDNRRKGRKPETMRDDILRTWRLLNGRTETYATDYRAILEQTSEQDLVYMDPPYQGVMTTRDPRYIQGVTYQQFVVELQKLNQRHIAYMVSYDGRTGDKAFGRQLPHALDLKLIELEAGRSSQSTLLGRADKTYESLYLSPALIERVSDKSIGIHNIPQQLPLFEKLS